ncbi:hypothetical protein PtA15_18A31 [Puccinia triticina]|uniref:SMP domain-containing protein n=1 Tax=Puccinia triticina TaxID=208348 RepID=A0ABY7D5P5_9BASI|nr:uncharacterized protein PtA15_18A31 [Puccinia triticina]WAQ92976.1 hypothetical protein PtA15_18A31 [Puccinia triticina]
MSAISRAKNINVADAAHTEETRIQEVDKAAKNTPKERQRSPSPVSQSQLSTQQQSSSVAVF